MAPATRAEVDDGLDVAFTAFMDGIDGDIVYLEDYLWAYRTCLFLIVMALAATFYLLMIAPAVLLHKPFTLRKRKARAVIAAMRTKR
jgi:hypothetical protein